MFHLLIAITRVVKLSLLFPTRIVWICDKRLFAPIFEYSIALIIGITKHWSTQL